MPDKLSDVFDIFVAKSIGIFLCVSNKSLVDAVSILMLIGTWLRAPNSFSDTFSFGEEVRVPCSILIKALDFVLGSLSLISPWFITAMSFA